MEQATEEGENQGVSHCLVLDLSLHDRHRNVIEHRTTSGHRINRIYRPQNMKQNIQATESTYICTTQLNRESRSIQVAWCMSKVNSSGSVVCCKLQCMQPTSRLQAALSLVVHETKSTDMHNTDWVRLASLVGMSCTVCMVAACTQG